MLCKVAFHTAFFNIEHLILNKSPFLKLNLLSQSRFG